MDNTEIQATFGTRQAKKKTKKNKNKQANKKHNTEK